MSKCEKPCSSCPWNKTTALKLGPEADGRFEAERMLGQVYGPFWLPCHSDYKGIAQDKLAENADNIRQCVGAWQFRQKLGIMEYLPKELRGVLREDTSEVFDSPQAFLAYHKQIPAVMATYYVAENLTKWRQRELDDAAVTVVTAPKPL